MDRFSLEVETVYCNDSGVQNNVFNLSPEELKSRIVDVMDFVKDPIASHDYCPEEDPKLYHSQKTGRGPLTENWVQEFVKAGKPVMCAYKMCKVEFRYWGMQTRAERWIHDLALRNTMLRAHRQAWAWQDEWRHYPQLRGRVHVVTVSCGSELDSVVSSLSSISASFGALLPSLSLIISSAQNLFGEAIEGTIRRANETYSEFIGSQPQFNGEIFVIGDTLGGLLLYEAMTKYEVAARQSSFRVKTPLGGTEEAASNHTNQALLPENQNHRSPKSHRNSVLSCPSVRKKASLGSASLDSMFVQSRLHFQPSTVFLLGCPLGLVLMQKQLAGYDIEPLETCQLFNLYYSLDPCGSRIEPVLNPQLKLLPAANVPKYQRYPLGDGHSLSFDSSVDKTNLWGDKRMDHVLYCPTALAMVALPSSALPNILHASYWESLDMAAFVLRQVVRREETASLTLSASLNHLPLKIELPPLQWKRKRTRFKVANLSPNHRANDVLVVAGSELSMTAKFCYGPMDLTALTRELASVFICPQRGDWYEVGAFETDSHGRLTVSLGNSLPCGIHSVKMVVHGDRSYLDSFVAVVPPTTKCVVFSVDGSLTASVSVTGRDPRVRPGAVDTVRYWHDQGYVILYLTARPDMQQRVVSAWLAQHCFPHGLLLFNPSFSTDPLKQKSLHLKHIIDMGIKVHAAYGSSKDVAVYCGAGVEQNRIVSVAGSRRRPCIFIESYSSHLEELSNGKSPLFQPSEMSEQINALGLAAAHR
ncbi:DDHD domain protein [Oesophagostomum dentatum]|uniref:DDHD domain protein n=1 Tax=Oesophagostomum dentatum TaxID=61180 RepID=A0A0B1TIG6_OESDE|nr:DDHD domain protein [Oesophagostomum dentatum]